MRLRLHSRRFTEGLSRPRSPKRAASGEYSSAVSGARICGFQADFLGLGAGLGFFSPLGVKGLGGVFSIFRRTSSREGSVLGMQNRLFPIHSAFPQEMAAAGRILLDYGEIEIDLMNCVQVRRKDMNGVFKAMFRTRGEKQRIEIADALGRIPYHEIKLGTEFETTMADVQHCRKIRNQYAHAYWANGGDGRLSFVGLEDLAKSHDRIDDLKKLPFFYVDLALLLLQEQFMWHTLTMLMYLNYEGRFLAGELTTRLFHEAPPQLERPSLHIPQVTVTHQ